MVLVYSHRGAHQYEISLKTLGTAQIRYPITRIEVPWISNIAENIRNKLKLGTRSLTQGCRKYEI